MYVKITEVVPVSDVVGVAVAVVDRVVCVALSLVGASPRGWLFR